MVETFLQVFVPIALTVLMFGMGLQLVAGDFIRVARFPKAALAGRLETRPVSWTSCDWSAFHPPRLLRRSECEAKV